MRRRKLAVVQPILSPYWRERLEALARLELFDIVLIVERQGFSHRPGWELRPIAGVRTVVAGSIVANRPVRRRTDGYRSDTLRSIPLALSWRIAMEKPNIVLYSNATQILLGLPAQLFLGAATVVLVEDTPHALRRLSPARRRLKEALYNRADLMLSLSDEADRFCRSFAEPERVRRTSWSVDTAKFTPRPGKERLTVVFVGQFIERKGLMPLIEAWARLQRDRAPEADLVMIGTGILFPRAESCIRDRNIPNLQLLGALEHGEVARWLSQADLFVLPTFEDLFSLAVLEAMAAGCAVITTPYAGASTLVQQAGAGWVVDPADPEALVAALRRALADRDALRRAGQAARDAAASMDHAAVMAELGDVLTTCIGAVPGHSAPSPDAP